ncbi:MAG: GntR family transcriptional regulator [Rhodothermales bacterium]|nr:GntR family transcriptional regulator [Rhodothermales bacterium]
MMLSTGKPRHEQISDWIRKKIVEGGYQVDEQLPSESQLGKQFSVSRITVRRALQTLQNEGLIYRRQGLGSFVQGVTVEQGLVRLTDFVEDMRIAGIEATSKVIAVGSTRASDEIAKALAIPAGSPVAKLDRLRLGDGDPIAFDRTWLPHSYWQYLDGRDLAGHSIYEILENDFGIHIRHGLFRISAVDAGKDVAEQLQIPKRRAVLLIERTSLTDAGRRVYYQRRYYRSDRVAYQVELERPDGSFARSRGGLPMQDFEPVFHKDTRE